MQRLAIVLGFSAVIGLCLGTPVARAHTERYTPSPVRAPIVVDPARQPTQEFDVCLTPDIDCEFSEIQPAVNAAPDGALIRIWPGTYTEPASRAAADADPADRDTCNLDPAANPDCKTAYSYAYQLAHPNAINLIAILGKKNITLRGMGKKPEDVVIDANFVKDVGIRGDRSDGIIIENLSVWRAYDHGVYILDSNGFLIDRVHGGFNRDYAFLTFADDHGLMKNSEAEGSGDAGLYPGGNANPVGRVAMEFDHCVSHDNTLGYSGTNGDSVWVHDSEFYGNAVGLVSDSETDHPNYPENHLRFERNLVHDNNLEVYGPNANVKATVFENSILIPIGVGVFLASGNDNFVGDNYIWGNKRYGVWLASGEGLIIGPTSTPPALPFMSSGNHFEGNHMTPPPGVQGAGNRIDFGWDGMGYDNCWEGNVGMNGAATSDPPLLPPCSVPVLGGPMPVTPPVPWAPGLIEQAGLIYVDLGLGNGSQPLCYQIGLEPCDWQPGPPTCPRNLPNCDAPVPTPTACGPNTCPS